MAHFLKKSSSIALDLLLTSSVVGIWPRFIEPRMLKITRLNYKGVPRSLDGFKIIHLSDLHFHAGLSASFLGKISKRVEEEKPDLVVFTGDFICYSRLEEEERLLKFLLTLKGKEGSFAVFGNHDYAAYVSRDSAGNYDTLAPPEPFQACRKALHQLVCPSLMKKKGIVSKRAATTPHHNSLTSLLEKASFRYLDNECHFLPQGLNIVGLGDYSLGRFQPKKAFKNYKKECFGLILTHNPDTFSSLLDYPGDIVLAGHSHGEQIHLPGFMQKFTRRLARLESSFTRGAFHEKGKLLYVNRGLASFKPFRFLSPPELVILTLHGDR